MAEIAGDILQGGVRDAGTPGQVQGAQLGQVLGDQLDAVVCDLTAAGQRQHRQVGQRTHDVHDAVVCHLPARLQSQHGQSATLARAEERQRRVGHVVRLQVELSERGQQLCNGADRVVGDVDAVADAERDDAGVETGPQPRLRHLVAPGQLEGVHGRKLVEHRLEAGVADVGAADAERDDGRVAGGQEPGRRVRRVTVRRAEQTQRVEAALHETAVEGATRLVVAVVLRPAPEVDDGRGAAPVDGPVRHVTPQPAHLRQTAQVGGGEVEEEDGEDLVVLPDVGQRRPLGGDGRQRRLRRRRLGPGPLRQTLHAARRRLDHPTDGARDTRRCSTRLARRPTLGRRRRRASSTQTEPFDAV